MKKSVLFIGLLLIGVSIYAQNDGRITGRIVDQETKEPVAQANVHVLQRKDSLFLNGVASDREGKVGLVTNFIAKFIKTWNTDLMF